MINLAGFVKALIPSFQRSDVLTDMEISLKHIPTILDVYSGLETTLKATKFKAPKNVKIIENFYRELKEETAPIKVSKNIATDHLNIYKNIKENGEWIYKEIEDAVNDVVVSAALSSYKAVLLRSIAHYYFITRYTLNLINFMYAAEVDNIESMENSYKLNKKQEEYINKNMWIYARLLSTYGVEKGKFEKAIESIEDIMLPKDTVDEVLEMYGDRQVDILYNLPKNFVGSPIYSMRLIFAQWETDRYKDLKDKKKMLELRLLHYKMMSETGMSDVDVEKEISYLQESITDLDYKISKMEEDVL